MFPELEGLKKKSHDQIKLQNIIGGNPTFNNLSHEFYLNHAMWCIKRTYMIGNNTTYVTMSQIKEQLTSFKALKTKLIDYIDYGLYELSPPFIRGGNAPALLSCYLTL